MAEKRKVSLAEFFASARPQKRAAGEQHGLPDPTRPLDRQQSIQDLIDWVRSLNGGYLHPSLKLKRLPSTDPGYMHPALKLEKHSTDGGLPDFTLMVDPESPRDAIKTGETLITVPVSATMSYLTFKESIEDEKHPLNKPLREKLDLTVLTALFLMTEYNDPDSRWRTYIRSLPQPFGSTIPFDTAAWYEGHDLGWLERTNVHGARKAEIERWQAEWKQICEIIEKDDWGSDQKHWILYQWAISIVSSRSFTSAILPTSHMERLKGSPREEFPVLIPLIDMLNHQPLKGVVWRAGENGIEFAVLGGLQPGEEVFNNYGPKNNEQLLMGYGFCLPNNRCDYYPVKIGIPPNSPLATAKAKQARLREKDPASAGGDALSKILGSSHVLSFNHPMRREGVEHSVFSQELLDNISILSANGRELEHLAVSVDRCWIDQGGNDHRNLLNTLCQLLSELRIRKNLLLVGSGERMYPVSVKQYNAWIYRDGMIDITTTAIEILTYCIWRSTFQFDDTQYSAQEEIVIQRLTAYFTGELEDKVRKALLYERNITRMGELFRPEDSAMLLPMPYHLALTEMWRDPERSGLVMGMDWTETQRNKTQHTIFVCCVYTLFKRDSFRREPEKPASYITNGTRFQADGQYRLQLWMEFLEDSYPTDVDLGLEDEDLEPGLPEYFESFEVSYREERSHRPLLEVEQTLSVDKWTKEAMEWSWRIVEEEGVNVPPLLRVRTLQDGEEIKHELDESRDEAEYYLYIPHPPHENGEENQDEWETV